MSRQMTRKQCKGCDVYFVALRSDALTCSSKCRKRYERMCREITRRAEETEKRRTEHAATKNKPLGSRLRGDLGTA